MHNFAATLKAITERPVLVPTWRIHCAHPGCQRVCVALTEQQAIEQLENHLRKVHQWPTHDANGNYIANLGD